MQLDPGRQLGPDIRVEGGGRLTLECLVDGAALLVRQRLEGVGNDDELVVGRVFAENFAGTVSVFAGAPGTAKAPLTSTAFAGGLAFGGGCCWAAARPMLPTNASASALVRTRSTSYGCLLFLRPRRVICPLSTDVSIFDSITPNLKIFFEEKTDA